MPFDAQNPPIAARRFAHPWPRSTSVSIAILLGSLLVLAGILSSLIALRFGAPLLLVFLLVGMLAGEGGPGGLKFDNVRVAYTVGSIALALILFDGGLRTKLATFRNVLAPAVMLATAGVLITTLITAPVAKFALDINWIQALLVGAVVASTDAAAVFILINAGGLRLRPRVRATLEVESGVNDPFAVFLALLLVQVLAVGGESWSHALVDLARDTLLGCVIGYAGGRIVILVLNRVSLAQGLHAPFVAVGAVVIFAFANAVHSSGFLAVYLAGLVVGNRQTRAHNSVIVFLDAVTWLAQIVMFVLLGLLVWPQRMGDSVIGAVLVAVVLMLIARPAAVFLCLAPFGFQWREKLFISWVGLRGAVGIFLASIPLLVGLPAGILYFDVAFVVVASSLLIQGWTVAFAARRLDMSYTRNDPLPRRVELDLPGQLAREIVGYPVPANSPYLRRGIIPNWARPTLVVRNEQILTPAEANPVREGDYVYLLRRRKRHRRSTASSSTCHRRPRPIRVCSAISSCRGARRLVPWRRFTGCRSPPTTSRCRSRPISPSSSVAARKPETSWPSVRLRYWRIRSMTAASTRSACDWPNRKRPRPCPAG